MVVSLGNDSQDFYSALYETKDYISRFPGDPLLSFFFLVADCDILKFKTCLTSIEFFALYFD